MYGCGCERNWYVQLPLCLTELKWRRVFTNQQGDHQLVKDHVLSTRLQRGAVIHMWAVGTQRCVFVPSPLVLHLLVVSIVGVLQQSRPLSSSAFISRSTPHYNQHFSDANIQNTACGRYQPIGLFPKGTSTNYWTNIFYFLSSALSNISLGIFAYQEVPLPPSGP